MRFFSRLTPWEWLTLALPAAVIALLVAAALLAPWVSGRDPYSLASVRLEESTRPPRWVDPQVAADGSGGYLLGTDVQGRDLLAAILYGMRVSLLVGVAGTVLAMSFGVAAGLLAGWRRGWSDALVMRLADVQLSFPSVLIALFLMAIWTGDGWWSRWGGGLAKIIIAVSIAHWVIYARTVRGSVLAERERDYIAAIRGLGAGGTRIVLRHLLPNVATPVLVISAVEFASIVMLEATLSFLGLGVPVTRPSLGTLIRFGFDEFATGAWWIWVFPGLALVTLILALNMVADGLRRRLGVGE